MDLTLSIDDRLVAKARKVAEVREMSLNQMVREELERLTAALSPDDLVQQLKAQWAREGPGSSEWRWNREELHDRPVHR